MTEHPIRRAMMLRYAIRTLRARKGGFIGALLALVCASALITACGVLLETGLRGSIATERYAATPVVVSADQNVHKTTVKHKKGKTKVKHKAKPLAEHVWLPYGTVRTVQRVPGVRRAVPELTFPAYAVTPGDRVLTGPGDTPSYGHAWSSAPLTPFALTRGSAPRSAGEVVVDRELAGRAGLEPGDRLTIQSTAAPRAYRVTGIAAPADGDLRRQTSLFFTDAEAGRLAAHPGRIAAIGVLAEPGTDRARLKRDLAAALSGTKARVHTGGDRGPAEFPDAAAARTRLVSMGGAMGGTSLLVAILVVVGTFALSIQQRHREIALLRAIAATPRQIRRLLGREALVVGLVAGVLGTLAGLPLAHWLYGRFVATGAVPATLHLAVGLYPMAAAVGTTLLGAWAAARISARRIVRIRPAEALSEAAVERPRPALGRVLAGLALLAGGVVLVVLLGHLHTEPASTPVAYLAVVVLAGAVALLGPLIVRTAVATLALPLRMARPWGRLATANLRGNATRMATAVTPLVLLIGMAATVLFLHPTLDDAARRQARDGSRADWTLASQGPGVPGAAAAAVRGTPGVTAATEVVRTTVRVGLDKYPAQGVTPEGLTRTWDPDVTRGSLARFGDGTVAVSEVAADDLHLAPGDMLKLTLGDGTRATLTVVAVYARGLGFGDLTMPHDLVARHVDNPLASSVLVAADHATRAGVAKAVRDFPGVRVLAPDRVEELRAATARSNAEVDYIAMGLIVAFTAIAVVNTLAMSTAERGREFAMLRLAGATRRQVLRMLRIETAGLLLIAAVLGTGTALAVLTAFSVGMTGGAAPTVVPLTYALVLGLAALLAFAATVLPGRLALTARPVDLASAKE